MPYRNLPDDPEIQNRMESCVQKVMGQGHEKQSAIAICYASITGKEYEPAIEVEPIRQYRIYDANTGETLKRADTAHEAATLAVEYKATADVNNLPDSAFLHVESGGEKDDTGKTVPRTLRHMPYKTDSGAVDLPHLRNALSRLGQMDTGVAGGEKWLTADLRKSLIAKAEKVLADNTDAASAGKEAKPTMLDRVMAFLRGDDSATKEGRRNASADETRLQQIHDLSVENGAACPMVFKDAKGNYRWITLSSNTYQDRDQEIVSQKAQDADTERMMAAKQYGPLRLWHLGYPDVNTKEAGPGVDIGDCDYSQMFGRVRVESGTFRDERTAAAIKGRADQWATSIGFFHPIDQPDHDGVYGDMHTFERSLLPHGRASNYFTPLAAIIKESNMSTKEEKVKQLTDLLGDAALADTVLKQVDATEKAAAERGLKFKEQQPEIEEDKAAKPAEPVAEKVAEPAVSDYAAMAKGLAPHIEKMIKDHMKEVAEKEISLQVALDQTATQLKETRQIVDKLNGDLPRAVRDAYRASQDDKTVSKDEKLKDFAPPDNPLKSTFDWLTSAMPMGVAPIVSEPPKAA